MYTNISVYISSCLAPGLFVWTDLLLSDPGGVLQLDDGLIECFLHLFHLFTVSEAHRCAEFQLSAVLTFKSMAKGFCF